MKKKAICLCLVLALLLCGCGQPQSGGETRIRSFTDSTGRTVTIPVNIQKIAVTGPLSQIYILPLAGDMLVGVSNAYAEDAQAYLPSYIYEKNRDRTAVWRQGRNGSRSTSGCRSGRCHRCRRAEENHRR